MFFSKYNKKIVDREGYELTEIFGISEELNDEFWNEYLFEYATTEPARKFTFKIMEQINKNFGSYESFKQQLTESSKVVEASGWNLLVWVPRFNKLEIIQCEKHQDLTLWDCKPLLVLDMWEHSYFLQYKTNRAEYISAFWNIVNWNEVNKRFKEI